MILFRMSNDANCDFKLLASNKNDHPAIQGISSHFGNSKIL